MRSSQGYLIAEGQCNLQLMQLVKYPLVVLEFGSSWGTDVATPVQAVGFSSDKVDRRCRSLLLRSTPDLLNPGRQTSGARLVQSAKDNLPPQEWIRKQCTSGHASVGFFFPPPDYDWAHLGAAVLLARSRDAAPSQEEFIPFPRCTRLYHHLVISHSGIKRGCCYLFVFFLRL